MRTLLFALLTIMTLSVIPVHADVYRWVDESGVESFADAEWKVPEKYRKKTKVIRERKAAPPAEQPPAQPDVTPSGVETGKPSGDGGEAEIKDDKAVEKPAPTGPVDNNGHDEGWWKARVEALRSKKAILEKELADLEDKIGASTDRAQIAARGLSQEKQQDQIKMLIRRDELKKELSDISYQLEQGLPDEARKAGAPPGWLR